MLQVVSIFNLAILQRIDHQTTLNREIITQKYGNVIAGSSSDDVNHSMWYWVILKQHRNIFALHQIIMIRMNNQ